MEQAFRLRPSLLLGTSTSATQVDGGELDHTWNDWHRKGYIKDGADPARAAGHWDRWREDTLLMRKMGIRTSRFSIEWARIEPEEGVFDEAAICHVKEELMLLIGLGIRPLVTLHHFTNPMWFENKGGWALPDNVRCFLLYVEKVVGKIGHLANEYITIDEPNLYAYNGYVRGIWPPGEKRPGMAFAVLSNLAAAHIKSYRLIHGMRRSMGFHDSRVGIALHMRAFTPKGSSPIYKRNAAEAERLFQGLIAAAVTTGQFRKPLKNYGRDRIGSYSDFHAVNYDTRSVIAFSEQLLKSGDKDDLGREIYPEGLLLCCEKLAGIAPKPIYITGNGACDLGNTFSCRFIYDHLRAISGSKLPIKRYYYRSFQDGFEWLEGEYARFGLVGTNFETMERSLKRSGRFYAELIRNGGVTQELYDEFVAGEVYHH